MFCFIQDEIFFNQNYGPSEFNCYLCQTKGHVLENCKHVHLFLDRGKVATKYYFSVPTKDRTCFQRKREKKFNWKLILNQDINMDILANNDCSNEKEEDDDFYENLYRTGSLNQDTLKKSISRGEMEILYSSSSSKSSFSHPNMNNRNNNNNNGQTIPNLNVMTEKKTEENLLDNLMKEFEKLKNFEFYYPSWNVKIVLKKYEEQRRKNLRILKKRTQRTDRSMETHSKNH